MKKLYFPNFWDSIEKNLTRESQNVIKFLEKNYNAHCFIVGGALRDTLLGRAVFDIDIECYKINIQEFQEAMDRLGALGVGKSFFGIKLVILNFLYRELKIK